MASAAETDLSTLPPHTCQIDKYYTFKVYDIDSSAGAQRKSGSTSNGSLRILEHSNHVAVVALDPSHPIFTDATCKDAKITRFSFSHPESVLTVRGKRKNGAKFVNETEILARFELDNGRSFKIPAGINLMLYAEEVVNGLFFLCEQGRLLEVNRAMAEDPNRLLRTHAQYGGYVAIVLCNLPSRSSSKKQKREGDGSDSEEDTEGGRD